MEHLTLTTPVRFPFIEILVHSNSFRRIFFMSNLEIMDDNQEIIGIIIKSSSYL